jgi:hypothetical protein
VRPCGRRRPLQQRPIGVRGVGVDPHIAEEAVVHCPGRVADVQVVKPETKLVLADEDDIDAVSEDETDDDLPEEDDDYEKPDDDDSTEEVEDDRKVKIENDLRFDDLDLDDDDDGFYNDDF